MSMLSPEKIAIIVPVYNVEKYLNQCVNSLLKQTWKNLEIILVDDGSTDRSGIICDEYSKIDPRIVVIHKTNGGQSSARNLGLEYSNADWFCFVDADDFVEPNYCEELLICAKENNCLVATCGFFEVDGATVCSKISENDLDKEFVVNRKEIIEGLCNQKFIRFEAWNKIWHRSAIGDVRFIEGKNCEEVDFDFKIFITLDKMAIINIPLYNYRVNRPGNTTSFFRESKMYIFEAFDALFIKMHQIDGFEDIYYVPRLLSIIYAYLFAFEAYNNGINRIVEQSILIFKKNYKLLLNLGYGFTHKERIKYTLFYCLGSKYILIWNKFKRRLNR